jgi:hypothetical protein
MIFYPYFKGTRTTIVFQEKFDKEIHSVRVEPEEGDLYNPLFGFLLAYFKMIKLLDGMSPKTFQRYLWSILYPMLFTEQLAFLKAVYFERERPTFMSFIKMCDDVQTFWAKRKNPLEYPKKSVLKFYWMITKEGLYPQIDGTFGQYDSAVLVDETYKNFLIQKYDLKDFSLSHAAPEKILNVYSKGFIGITCFNRERIITKINLLIDTGYGGIYKEFLKTLEE